MLYMYTIKLNKIYFELGRTEVEMVRILFPLRGGRIIIDRYKIDP
jgi:hypothetical protein